MVASFPKQELEVISDVSVGIIISVTQNADPDLVNIPSSNVDSSDSVGH